MKKRRIEKHYEPLLIILVIFAALIVLGNPIITGNATFTTETNTLSSARINLENYQQDNQELFSVMSWEVNQIELKDFEDRIEEIQNTEDSDTIQREEVEKVIDEWQTHVNALPKILTRTGSFSDDYFAEPNDLLDIVAEDQRDSAYFFQQDFDIRTTFTSYEVETYAGAEKTITLVTHEITPKIETGQVSVITAPPIIAQANIKFPDAGVRKEEDNYIQTYSQITSGTRISYAVQDVTVSAQNIFDYKIFITPSVTPNETPEFESEETEEAEYVCGDNICLAPFEDETVCPEDCAEPKRPFPWLLVVILAAVLIVGLLYLNAYKGRGDIRSITRGKSPFKTEEELKNVIEFIKKKINQGETQTEITKKLYEQKWTKKQIIYAYEQASWELRKVYIDKAPKSQTTNIKPMVDYIKKCLTVNAEQLQIKTNLLSKGWKPSQIEDAFLKAKKELYGK